MPNHLIVIWHFFNLFKIFWGLYTEGSLFLRKNRIHYFYLNNIGKFSIILSTFDNQNRLKINQILNNY
jgi:hypothetical protein